MANSEAQPVRSPAASVRVGWRPRVRSEAKPAGKQVLAIRRKRSDLLWPSAKLHSPCPRITCEHIGAHQAINGVVLGRCTRHDPHLASDRHGQIFTLKARDAEHAWYSKEAG